MNRIVTIAYLDESVDKLKEILEDNPQATFILGQMAHAVQSLKHGEVERHLAKGLFDFLQPDENAPDVEKDTTDEAGRDLPPCAKAEEGAGPDGKPRQIPNEVWERMKKDLPPPVVEAIKKAHARGQSSGIIVARITTEETTKESTEDTADE